MLTPCSLPLRLLLVAGLLSLVLVGQAAELVVRNLDFDVEFLPTDFDYKVTDSNATRSGSDAFDSAFALAVGARYSFARTGDAHGFLIGAQALVGQAAFGSIGHLTDFGLRAEGGYGVALDDHWTVNLLARVGYCWSTFDLSDNDVFSAVSLSGSAYSYGGAIGIDYAITERWQVSTNVGYLAYRYDLSGGGVDMTMDRHGLSASIGFLYRLSNLPSPLE